MSEMAGGNTSRLIETLRKWPGLDDDQLSRQSGVAPRQTVNQICRRLEDEGRLRRTKGPNDKIINTLSGPLAPSLLKEPASPKESSITRENSFQRVGSISNSHVGRDFEKAALAFFETTGIPLTPNFSIEIGHVKKRPHRFDLGSENPPILVECKSYTWTSGGNLPSAKILGINEVMLFFILAPSHYRKILFLLKHLRRDLSLAANYIKNHDHLVPPGIEVWEFDLETRAGQRLL